MAGKRKAPMPAELENNRKKLRTESVASETAALKTAVDQAKAAAPVNTDALNASSITAMLRQAIRGGDSNLLFKALDVKDKRVIAKSVNELKASEASTLLQKIVDQIQDTPLLSQQRHVWLQALLRHHAQVFASMPQMRPALETLAEHAQQRLANQNALMRLLGRTEIVLFQAERRLEGAKATSAAIEDARAPLVEFHQKALNDDEEDEEEDVGMSEDDDNVEGSDDEEEDGFDDEDDDAFDDDEDDE